MHNGESSDIFLEGIAKAVSELIDNSNADNAINNALSILGKHAEADRAYLFKYSIESLRKK